MDDQSRMPGFYKLSISERVRLVHERGLISEQDYQALVSGAHTLNPQRADKMIENVIGVMGLPNGIGLNFLINGEEYVVPLVVEEPSIVAALSSAAKLMRTAGGFKTESTEPILIGQVQVIDVPNSSQAQVALLQRREEIINLANSLHPNMVARGGGAEDMEVLIHPSPDGKGDMVVVHLLVNTCDAMGANLVNTMCEGVAPLVEIITGGRVLLRILSNLTDRSLVWAKTVIPVDQLAGKDHRGEQVRDGIILANDLAVVDPYRAATHNKGVMNGVDALALATGNDWRAIEAAAHAYAARGKHYTSLTHWYKNEKGDLVGSIEMPIKVGTVGGPLQSNPTVALNHRLLGVSSARELAEIMSAVGLAQNFAALRALVTSGIQEGHMTLHARSVAAAAGATPREFEALVARLLESEEIKIWKAKELLEQVREKSPTPQASTPKKPVSEEQYEAGHGKAILLGEHAVVYNSHAIATPVPLAIRVRIEEGVDGTTFMIPRWGVEQHLNEARARTGSFMQSLEMLLEHFELTDRSLQIQALPSVPRAMGLGGSAALAVAVIRALNGYCGLGLSEDDVCALAYKCEEFAHGTPSGIDNTVATYGRTLLFQRGDPPLIQSLTLPEPVSMVIGISGVESLTAKMVARVREAWQRNKALYERVFDDIDALTLQGVKALEAGDWQQLGELMNICQGQLNALQVSSPQLEELIQVARRNGAVGAKLTGGGGGGSIIALCPDEARGVVNAIEQAGYQALEVEIG